MRVLLCLLICIIAHASEAVPLGTEGRITITCEHKPIQIIYSEEHPGLNLRIIQSTTLDDGKQNVEIAWVSNRIGEHQLSDYLQYTDGSKLAIDDSITVVNAFGILPPDHDGAIHGQMAEIKQPFLLYQQWLIVLGIAWFVGLIVLIIVTRPKREEVEEVVVEPQLSLADHLRQLLSKSQSNSISEEDQARVERLIYIYWQRHLQISEKSVQEAIPLMRADAKAGPALLELDKLFHQRERSSNYDAALAPYTNISLAELES